MDIDKNRIINCLDEKDKNKLLFFAEVLFRHSKYRDLRDEISLRRKEIKEKKMISHQNFWREK